MSGSDYGVLVVKNGVLDLSLSSGSGDGFYLPELKGLTFYRTSIFDDLTEESEGALGFCLSEYNTFEYSTIKSKYWEYEGIKFKTALKNGFMVTTFTYKGDFYKVIQGYDVDDPKDGLFWSPKTKCKLLKLMRRYDLG